MDLNDTIQELLLRGERTPKAFDVFDNGATLTKVIVYGSDKEPELKEFAKPPVSRQHEFKSLVGFMDYLASHHCAEDNGILFVSDSSVTADLAYKKHDSQRILLPLAHSEEYEALRVLMQGIGQKGLWRLLVSKLKGCIDSSLLLAIAGIKVSGQTEKDVRIDVTGVQNGASRDSLSVTFQDKKDGATSTKEVHVDWTFIGRIWECFDAQYAIPLRLEVDTSDALKFIFHPERLEIVMRTARLDLVESIRASLPEQFTVHEGRI